MHMNFYCYVNYINCTVIVIPILYHFIFARFWLAQVNQTVKQELFEKVSLPRVPRKKGGREERWREGEKRFCGIVEGARQKQKHVGLAVSVIPNK